MIGCREPNYDTFSSGAPANKTLQQNRISPTTRPVAEPPVRPARLRRIILEQSKRANVGHIGSALSVADILAALYGDILHLPSPDAPERDRFILSKGHAALALYAALHLKGFLSAEELNTYCGDDSLLGVHPEQALTGVDFSTGSLGQGLSVGAGMALGARMSGHAHRVFALLSDAECNEGSLWEAVMFASHHGLSNLVAICDANGQQALGFTDQVLTLEPLPEKWRAFGWDVHEAPVARGRSDRRRVQHHLSRRGLSGAGSTGLLESPPRRRIDHRLSVGAQNVLGCTRDVARPEENVLTSSSSLGDLWARHHAEWRDTAQIASQWEEAAAVDPDLLRHSARGAFWEILEREKLTLLVTREYEHLVVALAVRDGRPVVSYLRLPHPSGLVYDRQREIVHVASTRNPNQIFTLAPVSGLERRKDVALARLDSNPLVPVAARFYPGSTYLHDLNLIAGELHANAVGQNAVVRVEGDGRLERVWWPRSIEKRGKPVFAQNHVQLNSIAAGPTIEASFFSASTDEITTRRPGHRNFPIDKRGVIFSGATREPIVYGLTRPHSARLHRRRLWVANSGYGELGVVRDGRYEPVVGLRGWTRGLTFCKDIAFVGTSRVIPRFRSYAPGLEVDKSMCGIHAIDTRTGKELARLVWPAGNQIFAVDWAPARVVSGFPFTLRSPGNSERARQLFYAFQTKKLK